MRASAGMSSPVGDPGQDRHGRDVVLAVHDVADATPRSRSPAPCCASAGQPWPATACEEQGDDFYERREHRNREHIAARHQQALQRLGYQVTLARIAGHQPVPA